MNGDVVGAVVVIAGLAIQVVQAGIAGMQLRSTLRRDRGLVPTWQCVPPSEEFADPGYRAHAGGTAARRQARTGARDDDLRH
ncbi:MULTISPECIES: hypothetical protein [Nocardia]|uniref:Uncharacterized protein n=1 Tax=Nocardia aurea TaxID=2144174 RepID=A0ABV3G1Z2_9NOCA|nr:MULTISPECIES: hypothetical protein [Nocardia]